MSASVLLLGAAPPSISTPLVLAVVGASSSSTAVSAAAAGEGGIVYPKTKTRSSLPATTATTTRGPTSEQRMVTTRSSKTKRPLDPSSARRSAAPLFSPRGGGGTTVVESCSPSSSSTNINVLFPIRSHELVKFLLIGTIKFFIVLALTLTRDGKDTLVVADCGAESIAFLKIYGVLPAATMFIATYAKLASIFDDRRDLLFYITCIPFFVFFYVFDRAIYPHRGSIQPSHDTVTSLLSSLFGGGRGDYHYNNHDDGNDIGGGNDNVNGGGGAMTMVLAKLIAHWTSALYYIIAEVYSSVSIGILFWQYANDVVSVDQAPRFYPLFAQMSGLAPIVAGQYVVRYASRAPDISTSLYRVTNLVTLCGIMICLFYRWSNMYIRRTEKKKENEEMMTTTTSTTTAATTTTTMKKKKKKKTKMTMIESTKFLASSEYLRLIATLVLGYGLSINFTEIIWKSCVKRQYPDPLDYQRYMANFSSIVGLSTCIVIFLGVHAIRILGWRIGALATPAAMGLLSVPYFLSILVGLDSPHRLRMAVIFGTIQSLISKTTKYALFDPTTQMAYIPLDEESKVKGKAAIEVLGSRIGKSGGSLVQQVLVLMFGNIISAAPILAVLYYAVLGWWAYSANRLSSLFYARTAAAAQEEEEERREKKED